MVTKGAARGFLKLGGVLMAADFFINTAGNTKVAKKGLTLSIFLNIAAFIYIIMAYVWNSMVRNVNSRREKNKR